MSVNAMTSAIYFAPLLPWQQTLWQQLINRVLAPQQSLPHALLAAGMPGMGKRAFMWRLVAWLLCQVRAQNLEGACGQCASCQWLKSGTHPSLQVLPLDNMPISAETQEKNARSENTAVKRKSDKSASTTTTIKIDDIRALQPFIYQGGQGMRICVLDNAEQMTIAAANALLKTLEEPQAQVYLLLISDRPAKLLPTIKSRVQQLPLQTITPETARRYVSQALDKTQSLNEITIDAKQVAQLLQLANGAPLAAVDLANAAWYSKRALWLTTWQALRSGKRSSIAASDYWQAQLPIIDFIKLCELMMVDIRRICLGLNSLQADIALGDSVKKYPPDPSALETLVHSIGQIKIALQQNVQEKFAYDKLMQQLALL